MSPPKGNPPTTTSTATTNEIQLIQPTQLSSMDIAARRSDLAQKYRTEHSEPVVTLDEDIVQYPNEQGNDDIQTHPTIEEQIRQVRNNQSISNSSDIPADTALATTSPSAATTTNSTKMKKSKNNDSTGGGIGTFGTILEGAFVDTAYAWPPVEGQGNNAIELQATVQLLEKNKDDDDDNNSFVTTESEKERLKLPEPPSVIKSRMATGTVATEGSTTAGGGGGGTTTTTTTEIVQKSRRCGYFSCCNKKSIMDSVVIGGRSTSDIEQMRLYKQKKLEVLERRRLHETEKKKRLQSKNKDYRLKNKYSRVPEGILIYRLDTSTGIIQLVSEPHSLTDTNTLLRTMKVIEAYPSSSTKNRRGIDLIGSDGTKATLVACEQRTATAWMEAIGIMHAKEESKLSQSEWSKERLKNNELHSIENSYLNLANFSNKLIRAGAIPGTKRGSGGAGGVYYSVERINEPGNNPQEEEALEAIAKRRAVIKDSWDFYRMICSLLRDRAKYEEVFRKLQLDPVYPYLNSMTGLNDPGDVGYENLDKQVIQRDLPMYKNMTKIQVANELVMQAERAMPSLVEICKALAGSLGMEEVGVGPIKDPDAAIRKAEKKYGGDILKVTDYCRALLVVKDIPSLLALLELARDSFGPLICRVKMSSLKEDHNPKAGGYRDCIINVELKGHVCEIQVHLWPMWVVCGVDGFRHYRHCIEYNTDSFEDSYDALDGLDRKTMAELIVVAEETVSETPLDNLEWYHEKLILDYFAEAGLFMKHKLYVWAEIIFRHLIRLRTESPDIGPNHHATIILYKYLAQCLKAQGRYDEAKELTAKLTESEVTKKEEKNQALKSMWESLGEVYDMVVDPSRKERESEEKKRKEVKLSKKRWRKIRKERFPFLDIDVDKGMNADFEEKKVD